MTVEELQIVITALGDATEVAGWVIGVFIFANSVIHPLIIAFTVLCICFWGRNLILVCNGFDRNPDQKQK